MTIKKLASALLAGALFFACAAPTGAVTVTETATPNKIFYRETMGQGTADEGDAIYDVVDITPATGSVMLTVKNSRTLKPISGAKYALYSGSQVVKFGLASDESGKITVNSLAPGEYELRQTAAPKGYQSAAGSVKFTVTGLSLSVGDKEIRTSEGEKIAANENEVLIAGTFSPNIELTAERGNQISDITVTYEKLDEVDEATVFHYVTLRAAQEEINHLKNEGEICGTVHISYTLKEPTGSYTQYLTEEMAATPSPTTVTTTAPAPATNSAPVATTAVPSPTPGPAATAAPAPSVAPITTPPPESVVEVAESTPEPPVKRDLTLTVLDTDGQPVPGVTVGIFEPVEIEPSPEKPATNSTDISQSISDIQNRKESEKLSADPYKRSAALQIAKTDENGQATLERAPVSELAAVALSVPAGYSKEKIPTEIAAGTAGNFTVTCPYVAVDLTLHSNATNSPVVGADVVLCSEDGDELASWVSEETAHRLIRVPAGEYTLRINSNGQNDKISFSVTDDKALQEVKIETYLPGIEPEKTAQIDLAELLPLLPYALGGLLVIGGTVAGILIFWHKRRSGGGMK